MSAIRDAATKMPCCGASPPRFEAQVIVGPRMIDPKKWCASIRVRCDHCRHNFRFEGLTPGVFGGGQPSSVSHTGYDALLPIDVLRNEIQQRCINEADPWGAAQAAAPRKVTDDRDVFCGTPSDLAPSEPKLYDGPTEKKWDDLTLPEKAARVHDVLWKAVEAQPPSGSEPPTITIGYLFAANLCSVLNKCHLALSAEAQEEQHG